MSFFPPNYEKPASNSNYLKLEEGQNKIRILSSAITGWIYWIDDEEGKRKPIRSKEKNNDDSKHFWSFIVWDYKDSKIKVAEITQASIQDAIFSLHNSEWGSPVDYDLMIDRTGQKLETRYTVMPAPKTELTPDILTTYQQANINLEALYDGADPFEGSKLSTSDQDIANMNQDEQPPHPGF